MQRTGRSVACLVRVAPSVAAAIGVGVSLTQVTRWNRSRWVAILQSLTPAIALSGVPVALIGVRRRHPLLAAAGATTAAVLGAVVVPAMRSSTGGDGGSDGLSIAHCNMLYLNVDRSADLAAALLDLGADVLAMSEFTEHHCRALIAADALAQYPHWVGRAARRSEGIVIWSRYPISEVSLAPLDTRPGIVATIDGPAGPMRIVLAHPDPPTMARGLASWEPSLDLIGSIGASAGPPTVIVADLNASRWHPVLRRLLGRGWRDAHELAGRGLSTSWPTDRRLPPFIRLDHALLRGDVELLDIVDFDAPGSDHRGFVVTVSPGSR